MWPTIYSHKKNKNPTKINTFCLIDQLDKRISDQWSNNCWKQSKRKQKYDWTKVLLIIDQIIVKSNQTQTKDPID